LSRSVISVPALAFYPDSAAKYPIMKDDPDQFGKAETIRRADELLKHLISRPPEPHASHRPGKAKTGKAKAAAGHRKDQRAVRREKRAT
jgi:hypothetical protein